MTSTARLSDLLQALDPGLPICVLVDPLLGEPPPVSVQERGDDPSAVDTARAQAWARDVQRIELPTGMGLAPRLHPYLVMLSGADDPWLETTWALAHAESAHAREDGLAGTGRTAMRIGGWLQCETDLPAMAQSLADLMRLRTAVSTPAKYLRLADRRTLDGLSVVIGRARLRAALGSLRRWCWLDACERLACVEMEGEGTPQALRLSADEWGVFALAEQVHPCVARWMGELDRSDSRPANADASQVIEQARHAVVAAQAAARRWPGHLPRPDDGIAWAVMSLLHPGFDNTPACREWLAKPVAGPDGDGDTFNSYCHTLRASLAPPSEYPT